MKTPPHPRGFTSALCLVVFLFTNACADPVYPAKGSAENPAPNSSEIDAGLDGSAPSPHDDGGNEAHVDGDMPDADANAVSPEDDATVPEPDADITPGPVVPVVPPKGVPIITAASVLATGYCQPVTVRLSASIGSGAFDANVSAGSLGAFYLDSACTDTNATTNVSLGRDGSTTTVYFKAQLSANDFVATGNLTLSHSEIHEGAVAVEIRREATEIAAGYKRGCALLDDGSVWCWGARNSAAISSLESYPSTIAEKPSRVSEISGGDVHSLLVGTTLACVLVGDAVRCFGEQPSLGNLDAAEDALVVTPKGLDSGVTALSVFRGHACAVKAGAVYCWGDDDGGFAKEPEVISGFTSGASQVTTGWGHVCAAMTEGGIQCWGANQYGQLGNGTKDEAAAPVAVQGLHAGVVRSMGAGFYKTCALIDDSLYCWGVEHAATATKMPGLDAEVTSFTLGGGHACAIASGKLHCWGENGIGQLGSEPWVDQSAPGLSPAGLPTPITASDAGTGPTTCAIARGLIYCWGRNRDGELGVSRDLKRVYAPTLVPMLASKQVSRLSFAPDATVTTCASYDGKTQCWGANDEGALGIGNAVETNATLLPTEVSGLGDSEALAAYGARNCAVDEGVVYCWGKSFSGPATVAPSAIALPAGNTALDVCLGADHACAITSGTKPGVYCWGSDDQGQLGDVDAHAQSSSAPVLVALSTTPTAITCSDTYTCAIVEGGVKCWGADVFGFSSETPTDVPGFAPGDPTHDPIVQIAAAYLESCARTDKGDVWCWSNGDDWYGPGKKMRQVVLPAPVDHIAAGSWTTFCARDASGLLCWGTNDDGQVGTGVATDDQPPPTRVPGLVAPIRTFATGLTSCAVDAQGMKCWGSNAGRTLGGDASFYELSPALTEPFVE